MCLKYVRSRNYRQKETVVKKKVFKKWWLEEPKAMKSKIISSERYRKIIMSYFYMPGTLLAASQKKWILGIVNVVFAVPFSHTPFRLVSRNRAMISKGLHLSSAFQSVLVLTGITQLKSQGSILEVKECHIAECITCQFWAVSYYTFN